MSGVLQGLSVLDLSWGLAGPMSTMLLADNGATVTRVRRPGGEPFIEPEGYTVWNRSKSTVELDLRDHDGYVRFLDMVRSADVLVESFAPDVPERLRIDHPTLAELNPRLIYCSITAYGRRTSHADRPGFDALVAARTGAQWDDRDENGSFGRGPNRPIMSALHGPSLAAAYLATIGISSALYAREQTGKGQHVETSLMQGVLHFYGYGWLGAENHESTVYSGGIMGEGNNWGIYEAADGWVCNWPGTPEWAIAAASGVELRRPDPTEFITHRSGKPRVLTTEQRLDILERGREAFRKFPVADWTALAAEMGIGLQAVRTPEEALWDPALLEEGSVMDVLDDQGVQRRQVGKLYRTGRYDPIGGGHGTESTPPKKNGNSAGTRTWEPLPVREIPGPLSGVRVLDFGLAVAGPWGMQALTDLGADVIKVDPEGQRAWLAGQMGLSVNTGKRSLGLDLKNPGSSEVLERLIRSADIVSMNMRPQAARRLGLDFDTLRQINPRIVYCRSRGFDSVSRADLPGTDQTANALAGGMYENGGVRDGGRPHFGSGSGGDLGCGFLSAIACIQALVDRERTGEGQEVDTSILNAVLFALSRVSAAEDREEDRVRLDRHQMGLLPTYRIFECSEGWLTIAVLSEEAWQRLTSVVPELGGIEFSTLVKRDEATETAVIAALTKAFGSESASAWFDRLDSASVPCEIYDETFASDVLEDPELLENHWVSIREGHPVAGRIRMFGIGIDFSDTPALPAPGPPVLGQHSREVLDDLGFSANEADALVDAGVVIEAPSPDPTIQL